MQDSSPVPVIPQPPVNRTLEVTITYLHRGGAVTQFLWVKVGPRHPALRVLLAPLLVGAMLGMFILLLVMLAFALLAIVLVSTFSRLGRRNFKA